jgi:uncharacterized membrane protein YsdA (DUF1294 family)
VILLSAWLVAVNVVTAVLYAYDKMAARRGSRRIRERTLQLGCWLGGVGGAWLMFLGLRHKTRHRSFWVIQTLATAAWAAVLVVAATRQGAT